MANEYRMTISWLTVDKLGIKLYDKVSAVIAELVSNSYDADATEVIIEAPIGKYLASKTGKSEERGYEIKVIDNGIGMTPEEINECYLIVGADRRDTRGRNRGDTSPKFGRHVMGRKGVGKLAPFGICKEIEVLTSGGDPNHEGKYLTAHFILNRENILNNDNNKENNHYQPEIGPLDNTPSDKTGTVITLRKFAYRKVSDYTTFARQLSQRFGLLSSDWCIKIRDKTKSSSEDGYEQILDKFTVETLDNTELNFEGPDGPNFSDSIEIESDYKAYGPDGSEMENLKAGFIYDEKFFPITGWVAYSKKPYKDDLMAGVRIYCRGKIAAQTSVFNREAGFHGEHNIRSYLVGELYADWLDEEEDLILTDRRDILWSHSVCQEFQKWGRAIIEKIGYISRNPRRKKRYERFLESGNVMERLHKEFPTSRYNDMRKEALDLIELWSKSLDDSEVENAEVVKEVLDIAITMAPHITLNSTLRQAADKEKTPIAMMGEILQTARLAELSSFGRIAEDRISVIERVQQLKENPSTAEMELQKLIKTAPWLIDPQWAPITANQTFNTLKRELQKYYKKSIGDEDFNLGDFQETNRRPDFILSSQDNGLQIIEIKRPGKRLTNEEMDRIVDYYDGLDDFLKHPGNTEFRESFRRHHITLVCDNVEQLSGSQKESLRSYLRDNKLTLISWATFLLRTEQMHQDFLKESQRQKQLLLDREREKAQTNHV